MQHTTKIYKILSNYFITPQAQESMVQEPA